MTRNRRIITIFIVLLVIVSLYANYPSRRTYAENNASYPQWGLLVEVFNLIDQAYYQPVQADNLINAAIRGLVAGLGDPYSVYMPKEEYHDFISNLEGSFGGVGMVVDIVDGQLTVVAPMKGTPAERAGIKAGDKLLKVGDRDLKGMSLQEAIKLIRGEPGTKVILTIQPAGSTETRQVELIREIIKTQSVEYRREGDDVGYIKIAQFQQGTGNEVLAALEDLNKQHIKGIILDLRNNPGGILDEGVRVASLFVPPGPVVYIVDRSGKKEAISANGRPSDLPILPVVVLVNGGTASAAEIVAGAILDRGEGLLVGTKTFGKGLVQSLLTLSNGAGLKLTTAKYLTPGMREINGQGLIPQFLVEDVSPPRLSPELNLSYSLRKGSQGQAVALLQELLKKVGYDPGPIDGIFGPKTKAAVEAFQKASGMEITGIVDGVVAEALNKATGALDRKESHPDLQLEKALEVVRTQISQRQ